MTSHIFVGIGSSAITLLVAYFTGVSSLKNRMGIVETKVDSTETRLTRVEKKVDDLRVSVAKLNGDGDPRPIE